MENANKSLINFSLIFISCKFIAFDCILYFAIHKIVSDFNFSNIFIFLVLFNIQVKSEFSLKHILTVWYCNLILFTIFVEFSISEFALQKLFHFSVSTV